MSGKTCVKCGEPFTGFGDTCGTCRKGGLKSQGTSRACEVCGAFFSGFGTQCDDCKRVSSKGAIANKAWDEDGIPLEDTNMAGVGGDEDKALRKSAALTEKAWMGVGFEPGLWIWRIERFKVVAWPKNQYGTFYDGDSYICLHTEMVQVEGDEEGKLERDIYFWLGKKTSTDEKGTAAYKTVELDDFFDGEPVQHREVQGRESDEFRDLFPNGLQILEGGVESGFNVVQQDIFKNKLYQVRRNEKKQIIIEEETVQLKSLNHRDAFMLDTGRKIYKWFGDSCSPFLKNACNMRAENLEAQRNGESECSDPDAAFWEALGGEGEITPADQVGEEVPADFGEGVLYSVNVNEARELDMKEVGRRDLERHMLDTTAVMLLDTNHEIFLWLGKEASEIEKRIAMKTGMNYLKMNNRKVDETPITVLKQGFGRKNKVWKKTFPV